MKLKKLVAPLLVGAIVSTAGLTLTGCGSSKNDYDVYLYSTKSEIADSLKELSKKYESEEGKKVKVYTCGTDEAMETLRSEMNSKNKPTIFSANQAQFVEWQEGGFALPSDKIQNSDLKAIYDEIADNMQLKDSDGNSYGIPYNVEGYGLIADTRMICDIFGLENADAFLADYDLANYEEFKTLILAVNDYINGNGGETVTLNGNSYVTAASKTENTQNLNGVFAIAGAEKWTYGNHYINYALNAVFPDFTSTASAKAADVEKLEQPMTKMLAQLQYLSDYAAGPSGAVKRGADFINSTVTGYDQAVQTFAEGKALFIKQGNWIYSNVEAVDADKANSLAMMPMKVNLDATDIKGEGVTVESLNSSIPEFVSQYYIINAKASSKEQKAAEDFLLWLNTSETGQDYIVNEFAFVPFNATSETELSNPLSRSLVKYMEKNAVLGNDFDAFPSQWGLNSIGTFIQEKMFTNEKGLSEDDIKAGVTQSISDWVKEIK